MVDLHQQFHAKTWHTTGEAHPVVPGVPHGGACSTHRSCTGGRASAWQSQSQPLESPPSFMEVRDAVLDDLPAIVAIYNTTIDSRMVTADLEPVSVEARRPWFDQHSPSHRPIWVAAENGQVIGWLSYSSFHPRAAYDATSEVSVYLAPE